MANLSPAEQELCTAIGEGRVAEFANHEAIAAETIRRIALGIKLEGKRAAVNCPAGVRVRGARIEGRIELANAGQGGNAAITLELEECVLEGGIDASRAVFAALSLRQSKIAFTPVPGPDGRLQPPINLTDAHVCGALVLNEIAPLSDDTYCYVRAEGAAIDGNVELARATLRAPAMDPSRPLDDSGTAALDLCLARIDGDLNMVGAPHITGAVRMRCTDVTGDVWIVNALILRASALVDGTQVPESPGEEACLFMQSINVGGCVNILGDSENRDRSGALQTMSAYGSVSLQLAEIGESLDILGCRIKGALLLRAATVGKSVNIMSAGRPGARIGRGIDASDVSIEADFRLAIPVDGDVELFSSTIGGELILSGLELHQGNLQLKAATIGRTLTIDQAKRRELRAIRSKKLTCLPNVTYIEVMANGNEPEDPPVQLSFLIRGKQIWRLEGKADLVPSLIKRFGHRIDSTEAAEEYLRLTCARHEGKDVRAGFLLIAPEPDVPLGLTLDLDSRASRLEDARQIEDDGHRNRVIAALTRAAEIDNFDVLARELFPLRCTSATDGTFRFEAAMIYEGNIYRSQFEVDASQPRVATVKMVDDEATGLTIANAPRVGTVFIEHSGQAKSSVLDSGFITAPAIGGMQVDSIGKGADQLLPHLRSGFSVSGYVNLIEASCGTLDDFSGLAWGAQTRVFSNHFTYDRTNWSDDEDRKRVLRARGFSIILSDESPFERVRFSVFQFGWLCRDITMWLLRGEAGSRYFGQDAERHHRNQWIRMQFLHIFASGKRVVSRLAYRPQPYEQIIKVSRAEGREDYAVWFEIEKRNVEASIRSRKLRLWTATAGLAAAALAAVFLTAESAGFGTAGLILLALAIFLGVTYFLDLANFIMRWCFGYLMRPFNAMVTLAALFALGWSGVNLANAQRMMVIDFSPVASVAYADGDNVQIGSGRGDSVVSNIHCGDEINEALYALDVLIPLIDLRQEEKCEVGLATVPETGMRARDRTALWAMAKALYAIFGWIVVSLVILTFVNTFRTKSEN